MRGPVLPLPCAPRSRGLRQLLERVAARLGVAAPSTVSFDMAQFWYLDATKAETELGLAPRDPIIRCTTR